MITENEVTDAVRRGYSDFNTSSNDEILDYFSNLDTSEFQGHLNNIKGITFEMEVARDLSGELFQETNHVGTDIMVDSNAYSIKSGVSVYETNQDISEGLEVIATSEIADRTLAIDSGISNEYLTDSVYQILIGG